MEDPQVAEYQCEAQGRISSKERSWRKAAPAKLPLGDRTVVMKSSNEDGAKGLNHPTDTRSQLERGRTEGRSKVGMGANRKIRAV